MSKGWERFHDLQVELVVAAGVAHLRVEDAIGQLKEGEIITLDSAADEPLRILLGSRCIAEGECALDGDRVEVRVSRITGCDGGAARDSDPAAADRLTGRWADSST